MIVYKFYNNYKLIFCVQYFIPSKYVVRQYNLFSPQNQIEILFIGRQKTNHF